MWFTKKTAVKICRRCSNVDAALLKTISKQEGFKLNVGCIGRCRQGHPELAGRSFGLIDGEFVACPTEGAFIEALQQAREGRQ